MTRRYTFNAIYAKWDNMSSETVFFDQMRNYIVYFQVFGLWSSWKNHKYKMLLKAHSVFPITIVFFSYMSAYFFNQFFEQTTLSSTISTGLFITVLIAHLIITIETFVRCCSQLALVQKFSLVDRMFNTKLLICIPYRKEKWDFFIRNSTLVFFVVSVKIFVIVYTVAEERVINFLYFLMYSNWILHLRAIQVLFFVYLVRSRLFLIDKEITDVRSALAARLNYKNEWQTILLMQKLAFSRIYHLKQIYGELYEINELINKTFGWSLLALMTQGFLDFIVNCYVVFTVLDALIIDYWALTISIVLLVPNIITISTVAFYCSSCFQSVRMLFIFWDLFIHLTIEKLLKNVYFVTGSCHWRQSPSHFIWQGQWGSEWFGARIFHASSSWAIYHIGKWVFQHKSWFVGIGNFFFCLKKDYNHSLCDGNYLFSRYLPQVWLI